MHSNENQPLISWIKYSIFMSPGWIIMTLELIPKPLGSHALTLAYGY